MYKRHFELERAPFRITPDTHSFYTGGDRGVILRALIYAIQNGDAIIKLVGEVGSGKTMLCRMLEQYLPQNVDIAYIANPRLTPDNILQTIAFELDLPISAHACSSRVLLLNTLQEYLLATHAQGRQVVLLVEEAQSIPTETLEEIRLLSNLETSRHKLLQIVLIGQPELDDILEKKEVRQIKDRIANSFYLPKLNKLDSTNYIQFRLHAAGHAGGSIFTKSSLRLIHKSSTGLLRKINIISDKALLAAYHAGSHTVTKKHVSQAVMEFHPQQKKASYWPGILTAAFSLIITISFGFLWKTMPEHRATIAGLNTLPAPQAGQTANLPSPALPALHASKIPVLSNDKQARITLKHHIARSEAWVEKADLNHFSIQVLLTNADDIEEVKQYLDTENRKFNKQATQKLFIVSANVKGQEMIRVLYGEYSNYSNAQQALNTLPDALHRFKPFITDLRSLKSGKVTTAKIGMREKDRP